MAKSNNPSSAMALPYSSETEANVLATCLMHGKYWSLVEALDPDATSLFYEDDHHRIAVAMRRVSGAGHTVDEGTIIDTLNASGVSLQGGTREFLTALGMRSSVRNQAEMKGLVSVLGEKRALRKIATEAAELSRRALDGESSPGELAEQMLGMSEYGRSSNVPIKRFGEYLDSMDTKTSYRVPSSLKDVNGIIGGFEAGRLYVIAARPKIGKTTLALNDVLEALASDAVVIFFSLEMPRRELWSRLLSCHSYVPQQDIQALLNKERKLEDFTEEQRVSIEQSTSAIKESDLYIIEAGDVRGGFHDVMATVVDIKSRYPEERPVIMFLDYLQLMVKDARETVSEVTNYTREAKLMASRLDIPIVILSQINRDGANEGMPNPHQMRGSGSIEQDADVVILLNRKSLQDETHPESDMDIWVALSRYSSTGWVRAFYAPEYQTITNAESNSYSVDDEDSRTPVLKKSSRPGDDDGEQEVEPDQDDDMDDIDFDEYADEFGSLED